MSKTTQLNPVFKQHFYYQNPVLFSQQLIYWQAQQGRHHLPWQQQSTPYSVLVSELMLQQTQVTTVIPYFERWMQRFPTLATLAKAAQDEVLSYWQGLGYYARARNLHKAAQYVVTEHQGQLPNTLEALKKVPGVGPYTAGAILSFAFNLPGPIVDGNVKRFFSRLFGIEGDLSKSAAIRQLWLLAEHLTPDSDNRAFAQGLLDMGATLCTKAQPNCAQCSFKSHCVAFNTNRQAALPQVIKKKKIPTRTVDFIYLRQAQNILLVKRPEQGIWGALWCLPELTDALKADNLPANTALVTQFTHTFTHFKMVGKLWQVSIHLTELATNPGLSASETRWVSLAELENYALPTPIRKTLHQLLAND